jgi:hypothetical protein
LLTQESIGIRLVSRGEPTQQRIKSRWQGFKTEASQGSLVNAVSTVQPPIDRWPTPTSRSARYGAAAAFCAMLASIAVMAPVAAADDASSP